VEPGWSENSNVACVLSVSSAGKTVICVAGSAITFHVKVAGEASVSGTRSTARISSTCAPPVSAESWYGDEQPSHGSTPSRRHSKASSAGTVPLSVPAKRTSTSGPLGFAGSGASSIVSGAPASVISHSKIAGSPSTSKFAFVGSTSKVCRFCSPASRPV
jgi:hypothetical protein